ncbi:MAG: DNA adenine methylase [Planctomycetes bacterium]|nr:DNA adenine methylase [Planctomycetota bacterium]
MNKTPRLTPPLKWHGGKTYLAERIIGLMPEHHHYVEPFCGGMAVLLRKDPEGVSEVANDLNGDLTNFFRVLQREKSFERFCRRVQAIPFSRVEWEDAEQFLREQPEADKVTRAAWFFVLNRMSLAGRMGAFTGITKTRTRGGMNAEVSAWRGCVEGLATVHERLMRVLIENRPAVELMRGHDVKGAVMYCDPPYPAGTRASPTVYGDYEMTDDDHRAFLATAKGLKHARILISGYPCPMYDKALRDWNRREFDLPNHAAGGKEKQRVTEVLWCNY